jgi:hypothetical protein
MLSVYELAIIALRSGAAFVRDPWSQNVTVQYPERVPGPVLDGLTARWPDLEALLSEHLPPNPVEIAQGFLVKTAPLSALSSG